MVTEVIQDGNTKITIHSPYGFIAMTPEEKQAFWESEVGRPIAAQIAEVLVKIHLSHQVSAGA